mmetsp:Transcript_11334/g.34734  ORF Transcript_11334/g.34734 Transcript_11334/m.34734 type:complete len:332 (-) Transcript_11334:55-1050(-)|eukprot:CAMPEP_0174235244 /NCGR_PEP_ID=MMETSP0417-20130205/4761_1 /TAXON_ID=242541 /ORGANISM="Mayorella sp, Strain BSH-02190019" /LENGTH=331 /DNA_ID=CAMNT_0015313729 /DNA_START=99 /DNA_END=1094 /DNA_ORIENTATION=-
MAETIQAIEKALELARTAVEKDEKGDPQNAARYYEKASKALKKQSALVPEQYRTILLEKNKMYRARLNEIRLVYPRSKSTSLQEDSSTTSKMTLTRITDLTATAGRRRGVTVTVGAQNKPASSRKRRNTERSKRRTRKDQLQIHFKTSEFSSMLVPQYEARSIPSGKGCRVVFLLDLLADSMYFGGYLSPSLCMPKEAWRQRCLRKTPEKTSILRRLADAFQALKPDPANPGSGKNLTALRESLDSLSAEIRTSLLDTCTTPSPVEVSKEDATEYLKELYRFCLMIQYLDSQHADLETIAQPLSSVIAPMILSDVRVLLQVYLERSVNALR